jgi:hypothetical protein
MWRELDLVLLKEVDEFGVIRKIEAELLKI